MIDLLINYCVRQPYRLGRWALGGHWTRDQSTWDAEYASGRWRYLHGTEEFGRYALIAGYVHHHLNLGAEGIVLDVGCGEAILFDHLWGFDPGRYLGCDLSAVAVDSARRRHPGLRLVVTPAESFRPEGGERFAAIVFNEVLYYLDRPGTVAENLAHRLAPGGVVIVSICAPRAHLKRASGAAVWHDLDRLAWPELDRLRLTNSGARLTWEIRVYEPK